MIRVSSNKLYSVVQAPSLQWGRDRSDSGGCGEIVGIAENPANNPHYTNKHVKEAG